VKGGPRGTHIGASDLTVIALVGVLILVGKTALRFGIALSGHGGVLWIAALIVGRSVVRRRWAGTMMGLTGGLLVAFLSPGTDGMLNVAKYVLPGLTLDLLMPLFGQRLDRAAPAAIAGAAAHATKVLVDVFVGVIAGLSPALIFVGLGLNVTLHVGFGALGGILAAGVLVALHRARIPQLRYLDEPPPGRGLAPVPQAAPDDPGATS
jgi:hypothetical protein